MASKYISNAEILKRRILNGDYAFKDLPSVRELAVEMGVSYVTAQRTYVELERWGTISRLPTGRIEITRDNQLAGAKMQVAFLTPTFKSQNIDMLRTALVNAGAQRGCKVRPVLYTHWEDPHLSDVLQLQSFDGVFLVPLPVPAPPGVLKSFRKAKKMVVMDEDMTHVGVPSLMLNPPVCQQYLLDHLDSLGHKHIDCLNVQPISPIIEQRIEQWRLWMSIHRYNGRMINEPVSINIFPYGQAYRVISRMLESGEFTATALLAITMPAALGAIRAFHEHGWKIGKDVSICTMESEDIATYLIPSITTLEESDAAPYIDICLNWMESKEAWVGPLLMQPRSLEVIHRESTGKI